MAEIKMNDPDLREIASALRYLEGREGEYSSNRRMWGELAGAIEEQVKPAVEEPEAFGSLVRATCGPGLVGVLWQKCPEKGKHYWESETGAIDVWSELTDVDVLRVGIGAEQSAKVGNLLNQLRYLVQAWESIPAQQVHDLITAFEIAAASEKP